MVANRIRNLVSLTRGAVRDARQALDELINSLGPRPQPALVRVPIRNQRGPRFPVPSGRRNFSTSTAFRSAASANRAFNFNFNHARFFKTTNFAGRLWPYSAFRSPSIGKGPFPSGLYRHFVNLNSRQFATFGGNVSHEAVQNLTANLRCFLNNSGNLAMNVKSNHNASNSIAQQYISYHGCASQNEAAKTFNMARAESSDVEALGSYVEFVLPKLELSIPDMSFMNSEILQSIESDLELVKERINRIQKEVELISEAYGSLPLERRKDSIRIHFPNLEVEEVERLLVDLGIDNGVVFANESEEVPDMSRSSSSYGSLSEDGLNSLSDLIENAVPDLISSGSDASSSMSSREYLPILSTSESQASHSEVGESYYFGDINTSSPITFARSTHSFSDIAV